MRAKGYNSTYIRIADTSRSCRSAADNNASAPLFLSRAPFSISLPLGQLEAMKHVRSAYGHVADAKHLLVLAVLVSHWIGVSLAVPRAAPAANSYAVTLDKTVPSSGDFDCGQTDSDGNSRSYCIVCSPAGGVRAVAAACDATPGCVAFDIQRRSGRCARLKSATGLMEGLEVTPGFTHYCKLNGSGRCRTAHFAWTPSVAIASRAAADLNCSRALTPQQSAATAVAPVPVSPVCSSCNRVSLVDSGGHCSVCGVDAMLLTCAANSDCAAVEYTQRDVCGRVKVITGPLAAAVDSNVYVKLPRRAAASGVASTTVPGNAAAASVAVARPAALPGAAASASASATATASATASSAVVGK